MLLAIEWQALGWYGPALVVLLPGTIDPTSLYWCFIRIYLARLLGIVLVLASTAGLILGLTTWLALFFIFFPPLLVAAVLISLLGVATIAASFKEEARLRPPAEKQAPTPPPEVVKGAEMGELLGGALASVILRLRKLRRR
jgi:hypothetical protein